MRINRQLPKEWPGWWYGPNGEGKIFEAAHEVPLGWVNHLGHTLFKPVEPIVLDKDDLIRELTAKGIEINPIWGNAHMKKVLDDCSTTR